MAGSRPERPRHALLHPDPAAERHRHAAHGPRVPAHAHGRAHPLPPHARLQHAVAAGHRPRRHRHADGRRAPARRARASRAHDLGREKFVERVWEWKEQSGAHHHAPDAPPRRLGRLVARALHDGPRLSRAVREVFVRLYEEGLIYRGKRLVNWDPVLLHGGVRPRGRQRGGGRPALAPPLSARATAAATSSSRPRGPRPCSATPRSRCIRTTSATAHLIGKTLRLPLDRPRRSRHRRRLRRSASSAPACVKITPAHDFNDYAVGQRHQLPLIDIFTLDATLNDNAPERYRGLDRFEARKRVLADLEARGPARARSSRTSCMVPRGDRTRRGGRADAHRPVVREDRRRSARARRIAGGRSGPRRSFVPENWTNTYYQWMRQHPGLVHLAPAVVGPPDPGLVRRRRATIYVGRRRGRGARASTSRRRSVPLRQDEDVLDTWFSSALWPFSTLGWPDETPRARSASMPSSACSSPASTSSSSGSRA